MTHVEELARIAVDTGFQLHKEIGPGLLESVYEALLAASLAERGIKIDRQKPIEIRYGGLVFAEGFPCRPHAGRQTDHRSQIGRSSGTRAWQAAAHLPAAFGPAARPSHELRWRDISRGRETGGQPAYRLCVFASSRESSGTGDTRLRKRVGRRPLGRIFEGSTHLGRPTRLACAARARHDRQPPCRSSYSIRALSSGS